MKNSIFAIPPDAWFDLCPFGVSGDLAIRAVVTCEGEVIFADGFESGDTSAWSVSVPLAGDPAAPRYPILTVDPALGSWRFLGDRD